ncbi:MAG: glycosyltransferase [Thermoprotei archaeon]
MFNTVMRVARKILGRKGTFILRSIMSELAFRLNLVPPANTIKRENGISAMVCTYNESDWIEPSLLSIKDLVDEYVVVDSSTDETPEIIKRIAEEHDLNLKMYRIPWGDLVKARNLALRESSYRWILHWDADFIASDDMPSFIKNFIKSLDERRYYLVYWPMVVLDADLFHQSPNFPIHIEHWLFTYSPVLRYEWVSMYDTLIAPLRYYKPIFINKYLGMHLRTVRNPVRLLYKSLWWRMRREGLERKMSLDDYVKMKIRELYGTTSIEEAARIHLQELLKKLVKYDKSKYIDYPRILKEYVKKKYGIDL